MAGNNPNLPADTVSRQIRVLLMPDIDGVVEDSDWEHIENDIKALKDRILDWANTVRGAIKGLAVDLPDGCIGRCKEKWRPLARVANVAGGDWPDIVHRLIEANMEEDKAEREAGLKKLPPGMVVMKDLHAVWPKGETFMSTKQLVSKLIMHNPEYWGTESPYGKPLNDTRLGRLITQAAKVTSSRPDTHGPRGYLRSTLAPVWRRLGIGRNKAGEPGETGEPGAEQRGVAGFAGSARFSGYLKTPTQPGDDGHDTAVDTAAEVLNGHIIDDRAVTHSEE
jgi:hypothetical protein